MDIKNLIVLESVEYDLIKNALKNNETYAFHGIECYLKKENVFAGEYILLPYNRKVSVELIISK